MKKILVCIVWFVFGSSNGLLAQKTIALCEHLERENVCLSQYASSLRTVALETSDKCLLSQSLNVWYTPQSIFINDLQSKKIYRFDASNGKFLNTIGALGQGPGEYARVMNIYVDDISKKVYLMDGMKKAILVYGYDGTFLFTFSNSFVSYNMARLGNSLVFSDAFYDQTGKDVYQTDMQGKLRHYSWFVNKQKSGLMIETPFFFDHHGHCGYKHILFDIIYELDDKLKKKPIYKIDNGKYGVDVKEDGYSLKKGPAKERESKVVVKSIRSSSRYLFITYSYKNQLCTIIYDEHTGRIINPGKDGHSGLVDDLHNGPLLNLNSTECPSYHSASRNELISVIYCSDLDDEQLQYFTKTLKKVDVDSNPIVRIITLKD